MGAVVSDRIENAAEPDIQAGRLTPLAYVRNFGDAHPTLSPDQALVEADRCYFCHDAPCIEACPTGIDIPSFIRKISTGNVRGAATTILDANIMGGMCGRVCPTEILCESVCVRTAQEAKPIEIGALQRYATDWLLERAIQPFARAPATGRRVAVVGAGPAGLACAHRLALHGHDVTVFEARPKPGGLNEYGIAAYKTADDFAQREVAFILGVGGIAIEYGKALGRGIALEDLRRDHDAVFLGIGHNAVNALGLGGEAVAGVMNAVDFIASLRQSADKSLLPVGRNVVVIGGGNTAIDAAVQARRLGAENVTLVYRRGPDEMGATRDEQEWAQVNGVRIKHWSVPVQLCGDPVRSVVFGYAERDATGRATPTGETYELAADMVLKAMGQLFVAAPLGAATGLELERGRIAIDGDRRTSLPRVYAGGDCTVGMDLTVSAVEDGKQAAEQIHRDLAAGGR